MNMFFTKLNKINLAFSFILKTLSNEIRMITRIVSRLILSLDFCRLCESNFKVTLVNLWNIPTRNSEGILLVD